MVIQLLVRIDGKPEKTVNVSKDVIIGRSKTCQFRVLSNDVSREHCKLLVSDELVAIRDLGSSNGTVVNGKTVPSGMDIVLPPGANVEVGPLKFVVNFKSKTSAVPAEETMLEAAQPQPRPAKAAVTKTITPPAAAEEDESATIGEETLPEMQAAKPAPKAPATPAKSAPTKATVSKAAAPTAAGKPTAATDKPTQKTKPAAAPGESTNADKTSAAKPAAAKTGTAKPGAAIAKSGATAAAKSSAAATAATPAKKKVAKKPAAPAAPVADEPEFPFGIAAGEADQSSDGAWPDFLLGDVSGEGPTVAKSTQAAEPTAEPAAVAEEFSFSNINESDEPVFDFDPSGDDAAPTFETAAPAEPEEVLEVNAEADDSAPVAVTPVVTTTSKVTEPTTVAAADDEPVFDFAESDGGFDPDAMLEAAESAPATPAAAHAPKPEANQPGKLKSLFGLFGKNKDKAAPAKPATPAPTTPAPAAPAAAAATATATTVGADDDMMNDFLAGGPGVGAAHGTDDDTPDWMQQLS